MINYHSKIGGSEFEEVTLQISDLVLLLEEQFGRFDIIRLRGSQHLLGCFKTVFSRVKHGLCLCSARVNLSNFHLGVSYNRNLGQPCLAMSTIVRMLPVRRTYSCR